MQKHSKPVYGFTLRNKLPNKKKAQGRSASLVAKCYIRLTEIDNGIIKMILNIIEAERNILLTALKNLRQLNKEGANSFDVELICSNLTDKLCTTVTISDFLNANKDYDYREAPIATQAKQSTPNKHEEADDTSFF